MEPENTTWIKDSPRRVIVIGNSTNEKKNVYIDDEINCERLSENDSCTVNTCNTAVGETVVINKDLLNSLFKFKPLSKLKQFIAERTKVRKTYYTLAEILTILKNVIRSERMFDSRNPSVILCSPELERALNMKALHVTEIRGLVLLQTTKVEDQTLKKFTHMIPNDDLQSDLNAELKHTKNDDRKPQPLKVIKVTNIPAAIFTDKNARFNLKPKFLKVIHSIPNVNLEQNIFSYEEITLLVSKYIILKKNDIFDPRNIKVALVGNDIIGDAFEVQAFHRCQINNLIRNQLIPINSTDRSNENQVNDPPAGELVAMKKDDYNISKKRNNSGSGVEQLNMAKQLRTTKQDRTCFKGMIVPNEDNANEAQEFQSLQKVVESLIAEKTTLEKQLKELERVAHDKQQKEKDIEMKFSIEKTGLLKKITDKEKQLKKLNNEKTDLLELLNKAKEDAVLNDNYKREIIDIGTEMLKEKCKQYDNEVRKNIILKQRIEQQSTEIVKMKSSKDITKYEMTHDADTDVSSKIEEQGSTKTCGLVIKNVVTLLNDDISSPFTKPQNKYTVIRNENDDIDTDVYEGIVEALYETKKDKSDAEIQGRYEMLLKDLVEKMPCDRNTVVRSLRKAFKTVMPDFTFENVPEVTMKCSASTGIETQKKKQFVLLELRHKNQQNAIYN